MSKNITLDFTAGKSLNNIATEQPLAIMPAVLAQKLLSMYAEKMYYSSADAIISRHADDLKQYANANDLDGAIQASLSWVMERELIANIQSGNWDAYAVAEDLKPVSPEYIDNN